MSRSYRYARLKIIYHLNRTKFPYGTTAVIVGYGSPDSDLLLDGFSCVEADQMDLIFDGGQCGILIPDSSDVLKSLDSRD
jgi:hypothetical protein